MLLAPELKKQRKLDSRFRGNDIERLSWKDSLPIQKFLDIIAQIIADEFIKTAKGNPKIFTTGG